MTEQGTSADRTRRNLIGFPQGEALAGMTKAVAAVSALAIAVLPSQAAKADVVIQAEKAAIRTEGGPASGGGWNLWSNGHVGQPIRIATAGKYGVVVRAWGSPAGGVWPEMALLVDGRAVKTVSVDQAKPKDFAFQVELTTGDHEIAAAFLNDALIGKEDRNLYLARITIIPPSAAPDPTFPTLKEMAEAAEARERAVVAATKLAIEKNRKAEAKIRLVDAEGRPVPDVRLAVEQTGHDFLFGANIFGFDRYRTVAQNATYKKRFEELLNYATVGFYWRWYERERGKSNYEYTDKVVAWCREHGIRMKGHPLLWADQAGIPVWSQGQPSPEIQRRRVEDDDVVRGRLGQRQAALAVRGRVHAVARLAEPSLEGAEQRLVVLDQQEAHRSTATLVRRTGGANMRRA